MATTECVVEENILRKFAQKLASNEKRIRDMTLKKLRKWMETRLKSSDGGFSEVDFLKLWKGLHFSMWMADKPLVQEDLADKISGLVHCIGPIDSRLLFIDTFFQTQAREWFGIDRYRLDKFMMLIRRFLGQSLATLKAEKWNLRVLSGFIEVLAKNVINGTDDVPNGLKYHVADIYLDELSKAGADQLTASQVQRLLDPYCLLLAETNDKLLFGQVMKKIFKPILAWCNESVVASQDAEMNGESSDEDVDDDDDEDLSSKRAPSPRLKVDCGLLADCLYELASEGKCATRNRATLYSLVKKLRQLDAGDVPEAEEEEDSEDVVDDDAVAEDSTEFDSAVARLQSMYQEHLDEAEAHRLAKKKRHRRDDAEDDGDDDDTADVPPAKVQKRAADEESVARKKAKKELALKKEKKKKQLERESAQDQAKAAKLQKKLLQQQQQQQLHYINNNASDDENSNSESDSDDEQVHVATGNGVKAPKSNGIKSVKATASSSSLPKSSKSKSEQGLFIGGFEDDDDNNYINLESNVKQSKKAKKADKLQKKHAKNGSAKKVQDSSWEVTPIGMPDKVATVTPADGNATPGLNTSTSSHFKVSPKVHKETSPRSNSAEKKASPKSPLHLKEATPANKQSPKGTPNKEPLVQFVQQDSPSAVFFKKAAKSLSPKKALMLTPQSSVALSSELSSSSKKKVIFAMDRNCARNYHESIIKLSTSPLSSPSTLAKSILKSSPANHGSPLSRMGAADFF